MSVLTRAPAADGGAVQAELTAATWPEPVSVSMTDAATVFAFGLSYPSGELTTITRGTSP